MEADLQGAKSHEKGWTAVASLHRAILGARKELDAELAKLETRTKKAPKAIAEQVANLKKAAETWPDPLLVAVVEVYCARYKLDMPRPMRKVQKAGS